MWTYATAWMLHANCSGSSVDPAHAQVTAMIAPAHRPATLAAAHATSAIPASVRIHGASSQRVRCPGTHRVSCSNHSAEYQGALPRTVWAKSGALADSCPISGAAAMSALR